MFTHNLVVRHANGEYEGFSGCGSTAEAAERNARAKAARDIGAKLLDPSKVSFLTEEEFGGLDDETKATIRRDWRLSGRSAATSKTPPANEGRPSGEALLPYHAVLSPARHAELLAGAKPQLDIRREPTGWMFVDFDNGRILVHPAEPKAVQFAAADARSGTGLLRAKAQAQAYAVDHPVTRAAALTAGRLRRGSPPKLERDEGGRLLSYAWPGGYPLVYRAADGGTLCPACANGENGSRSPGPSDDALDPECPDDDQWRVVSCDIHYEGPPEVCDHCNAAIESAYGDPDAPKPEGDDVCASATTETETLSDQDALDQMRGLLSSRPWDQAAARQVAELLRETGREVDEPEGELDEGEPDDDEWGAGPSAYSRISSRIAAPDAARYKSDADIADEFAGFTIESIEVNPKKHEEQSWLSGWMSIHFPNADEHVAGGMEGPATVTDRFMVYDASDVAGSEIRWENWYPPEVSKELEGAIRTKLLASPAGGSRRSTRRAPRGAARPEVTGLKAVRYNMGVDRPPEWHLKYMRGNKPCSIPLPNTNPDLWRPPLGRDLIEALKKIGVKETPGMLDSVEVVW